VVLRKASEKRASKEVNQEQPKQEEATKVSKSDSKKVNIILDVTKGGDKEAEKSKDVKVTKSETKEAA